MFIAAYEGYFDKENDWVTVMRQVAMFASQRSSDEFNKYWPVIGKERDIKVWGSKEDAAELRARIEKAHKIKLS